MGKSKWRGAARIGMIAALLLPLLPIVVWSVAHRWYFPALLPTEWSLRGWSYLFSPASQVGSALWNSVVTATAVTIVSLLIGVPAGRVMGLHLFRGKTAVNFLILAPAIVPTLAVAMGIHVAFIRYGLADTVGGVVLAHLIPTAPYVVFIMSGVFANYDADYESQARTLGANKWQVLRHITLPAIFPSMMVGGLFAFIISWSQYTLTLLIGGGRVVTLPVLLFTFANSGDNTITAVLSLVYIAPAILFLLFTTRHLTMNNEPLTMNS